MPEEGEGKLIVNPEIYKIRLQFNDGRQFEAETCSETNPLEALAGAIAIMEYIDAMPEPAKEPSRRLESVAIDECVDEFNDFILEMAEAVGRLSEQEREIIVESARSLARGQIPFFEFIKV